MKFEIGGDIKTTDYLLLNKLFAKLGCEKVNETNDGFIIFYNPNINLKFVVTIQNEEYLYRVYLEDIIECQVVLLYDEIRSVFDYYKIIYIIELENETGEIMLRYSNWI